MTTKPVAAFRAASHNDQEVPALCNEYPRSPLHLQSLEEAADILINEARMVLPGLQALFGFQLIAVFTERFASMSPWLQGLHLFATGLVALAVALIMTPAAYHRIAERGFVSKRF